MNIEKIKNSNNIENLYSNDYNFDTRKKLNVSNIVIPQDIIDEIEKNGITSEGLEKLGVPYFVYKTQITLHGNFDKLKNPYSFGYKNLIVNKNGSLGVKYNAIDEAKRKELAKMLSIVGISYYRNSINSEFIVMKYVEEGTMDYLKSLIKITEDNKDLFIGSAFLQKVNFFGREVAWVTIRVNMIKQENVSKFAKAFGWSIQKQKEVELEKETIRLKHVQSWDAKMAERDRVIKETEQELSRLNLIKQKYDIESDRVYLRTDVRSDYKTDKYKAEYIIHTTKKLKGKRVISYIEKTFDNLNDAIIFSKNVDIDKEFDNIHSYEIKNYPMNHTRRIILLK